MDELKKYLQQHREMLDADEPSPMIWESIQQKQPMKKAVTVMMITRWVAAACILVLAGIGIQSLLKEQETPASSTNTATITRPKQAPVPEETAIPVATPQEPIIAATTPAKKVQPKPTHRKDLMLLHNIENNFKQVINLQRERVGTIPMFAESADYFTDFKVQIGQLEKDEKSIKKEIVKRGMTDKLLSQLINIYQIKLSTLKQLQIEMNKINNRFKQNQGPVDSTKTYFIHI